MQTKAPGWFVVVAVLAVLWNLVGCLAIGANIAVVASGAVSQLPAEQQAVHAAQPAWTLAGSILGVLGGFFGSLGLLMRRRWATPLLMVSVLGLVVQDIGFAIAAQAAVIPMAGLVMQGVVLLIAIGLVLLARKAARSGWLR